MATHPTNSEMKARTDEVPSDDRVKRQRAKSRTTTDSTSMPKTSRALTRDLVKHVWRGVCRATSKAAEHSVATGLSVVGAAAIGAGGWFGPALLIAWGVLSPTTPPPRSSTPAVDYVMMVRGVKPSGCKIETGQSIMDVLKDRNNAAIDTINLKVSRPSRGDGFEGIKSWERTGSSEKIAGFWKNNLSLVATTVDATPDQQATYRGEFASSLGFYVAEESAHDCVTGVNLVCPVVIGPREKVGEMRALLQSELDTQTKEGRPFCVVSPAAGLKPTPFALAKP